MNEGFFKRDLARELLTQARHYPVVTLMGPRQSGKTTLVQEAFPEKKYLNLEEPDVREFAQTDPRGFLAATPPAGVILDEIQRAPELLSYIQIIVDSQAAQGRFILTGSHQLNLHQAITQSLAGRTALLYLLPLSLVELAQADYNLSMDEYLLHGFYPRVYKDQLNPTKAYRNYFQTYVERDVRSLIHLKDLHTFQVFIKLCAGRIGSILNIDNLSNEVGVSAPTIKNWLAILEASFVLLRLYPYFENFGKRIIKAPKIYFTDVGLATYLLGIENLQQLSRDPLRGHLVENLVVLELIKARANQGLEPQLYYYRDNHANEIDVIFQRGQHLIPIEIKAAQTFQRGFLKNLKFYEQLVGEKFSCGYLIYAGEHQQHIGPFQVLNFKQGYQAVA